MSNPSAILYSTVNNLALFLGRFLLAIFPAHEAWYKSQFFDHQVNWYTQLNLPMPELAVSLVVGLGALVAIMLVVGLWVRYAVLLLAFFVLLDALIVRFPFMTDFSNLYVFLLDLAVLGGCLAFFVAGAGAWSVNGSHPNAD